MPQFKFITASFIGISTLATPLFADVTGPEVWADWKAYMQSFGYELTATEQQSGGVLSVSDVQMNVAFPEGTFNVVMPNISFTETGSGTVSVDFPATIPINFSITPKMGESVSASLIYTQDAPTMIASGSNGDMTYTYAAKTVGMTMGDIVVDGKNLGSDLMRMNINLDDVASVTRMKIDNLRHFEQTTSASLLSYDVAFADPEGGGSGTFKGNIQNLKSDSVGAMPTGGTIDPQDINAMLAAGFSMKGGFAYSGGNGTIAIQSPDGPVNGQTKSNGGRLSIDMSENGLTYDVQQQDLSVTMQAATLPFPVAFDMGKAAFNLTMPMRESQDPQGFAFGFTMGDFTMSDMIWGIFDPTGQLPRDPATIALDLSGTARILANFMDPEAMARSGETPGELNSLDVNNLLIKIIGAELTGNGGFTFDNSDLITFNGMPKPTGALNLNLTGANAVIDKLVSMGLLPQEQAMGARMMMGLFAVPQGDDVLSSKIEINEQGHVLANGQRIQ